MSLITIPQYNNLMYRLYYNVDETKASFKKRAEFLQSFKNLVDEHLKIFSPNDEIVVSHVSVYGAYTLRSYKADMDVVIFVDAMDVDFLIENVDQIDFLSEARRFQKFFDDIHKSLELPTTPELKNPLSYWRDDHNDFYSDLSKYMDDPAFFEAQYITFEEYEKECMPVFNQLSEAMFGYIVDGNLFRDIDKDLEFTINMDGRVIVRECGMGGQVCDFDQLTHPNEIEKHITLPLFNKLFIWFVFNAKSPLHSSKPIVEL